MSRKRRKKVSRKPGVDQTAEILTPQQRAQLVGEAFENYSFSGVRFEGFSTWKMFPHIKLRIGRLLFLDAIQDHWPDLWRNLREQVCLAKDPPELSTWLAKQGRGISDEWLINVCRGTVALWKQYPDSPQANLAKEQKATLIARSAIVSPLAPAKCRWYSYEDQPVLTHPGPFQLKITVDAGSEANPAVLRRQIMNEVRRRWNIYSAAHREWNTGRAWEKHAVLTALYLSGETTLTIQKKFPELVREYDEVKSTIEKAVKRFAKAIELTLSKKVDKR